MVNSNIALDIPAKIEQVSDPLADVLFASVVMSSKNLPFFMESSWTILSGLLRLTFSRVMTTELRQVDGISTSLQLFSSFKGIMGHVAGNLTLLSDTIELMLDGILPQAAVAVQAATRVADDALACAGEAIGRVQQISQDFLRRVPRCILRAHNWRIGRGQAGSAV